MTVRWRLLLTLGGIIVLLTLPSIYGVTQLQRLRDLAENLEAVHANEVMQLGRAAATLKEVQRLQQILVANPTEQARHDLTIELQIVRDNLRFLRPGYTEQADPALTLLDSLDARNDRIIDLVETGERQAATDFFVDSVRPIVTAASEALDPLKDAMDQRGRSVRREAQAVSASAARTTLLVVAIALLLTVILGLWTTGALSRPLSRLSEATAIVADGEFNAPEGLPYDRSDEIGHLSRSFGAMTERLAELDRLKAEFVSLATHELKTPINVIGGYAELLDEGLYGQLDEKQHEIIGLIQDQTRSLTRLVNQLLDLSRFEAGGLRIEPHPVELGTLLSEVESSFRALATQKQIDFQVKTRGEIPDRVVLDHDRIRHEVLGNLLSNAFKFTDPGGEVRVCAWDEGGRVHVEVSDTGVGIPEEQLPHIFEKYYQVGAEAKAQGSGLGLAIAKHVVDAHRGDITARSKVGEGTRFRFSLPHGDPAADGAGE